MRLEILPDESHRLKLAALNREGGNLDQPQIVSSPREVVVATPLPNSGQPVQTAANTTATGAPPAQPRGAAPIPVLSEKVQILPVSPTGIFVQTGAFTKLENALRMRDRVYAMGPTQISRFRVAGAELYRVRIGPLQSVTLADATLSKLTGAGVADARLVVE